MAERDEHKLFKSVVVILLLFITFFLGSIWFQTLGGGYGHGGGMCAYPKMEGKFCPITGKMFKGAPEQK